MSEETVLEVSGLEVTYSTNRGDVKAVQDLDLSVRRGEILGIAGESGSGKSTLAVALLRLLKPPGRVTGGSVVFGTQRRLRHYIHGWLPRGDCTEAISCKEWAAGRVI